ncbi:MAG: pyridoxamine kinase [Lachnospiraceae bacterium]
MSHNHQKKIAVINDISGFGRCSIAVALPIISMLKVQCCPLPTSIFSNHTGYPSFFMEDFTANMRPYMKEWKKLDLEFDGICTGFLGSVEQISIVQDFIKQFCSPKTQVLVDPVMGDYGIPYGTYTDEMCQQMKTLVLQADIVTPNVTEACILTDTPYRKDLRLDEVCALASHLCEMGPKKVVITGFQQDSRLCNVCYERGKNFSFIRTEKIGEDRSGTGDIFSAILAADMVNGVPFTDSVQKAVDFISSCIEASVARDIPVTDGVAFEDVLDTLCV